ncbi:hypothetical protein [Candidatus Mycoplasma haematohominis]|uniref:hypothetical protein n=1 Tax=Candidatus Mycoplasma haematohominis TaxID=1494318 RepID=UPI001C0A75D3|nr:hypothetical protein [Candidatus Mycoplasma haemohominis]
MDEQESEEKEKLELQEKEEERRLAEKQKQKEEAEKAEQELKESEAFENYIFKLKEKELDEELEKFADVLVSALQAVEGGEEESKSKVKRKRAKRDGGRGDRKELLVELKGLATEAKSKLRTDISGFWNAGRFLDDLIKADERTVNFRELKWFLGNLNGCKGMYKSSSSGCDD